MGFSIVGLLIAIIIVLPSIIFATKFPPKNIPNGVDSTNKIFNILENIGQISCLTIIVISKYLFDNFTVNIWTIIITISIILYYALWIRYVVKGGDYSLLVKPFLFIPIPLAILPILVFGSIAIMNSAIILGIATICLAIGHITISYENYKLTRK